MTNTTCRTHMIYKAVSIRVDLIVINYRLKVKVVLIHYNSIAVGRCSTP
jgi:hypothetical protein